MQAKDVMTPSPVTIEPESDVRSAAKLLYQHRISALPVVADGRPVGIVSEGDLMRRTEIDTTPHRSWWLKMFDLPQDRAVAYLKAHAHRVADVMTPSPVTVSEDAPLREIADALEHHRIKRVLVVRDGELVGVVSRANLIQALAAGPSEQVTDRGDDREIRERILTIAQKEIGISAAFMNVLVADGVVSLWGLVDSLEQEAALRVAAENTPGVVRVEDRMVRRSGVLATGL